MNPVDAFFSSTRTQLREDPEMVASYNEAPVLSPTSRYGTVFVAYIRISDRPERNNFSTSDNQLERTESVSCGTTHFRRLRMKGSEPGWLRPSRGCSQLMTVTNKVMNPHSRIRSTPTTMNCERCENSRCREKNFAFQGVAESRIEGIISENLSNGKPPEVLLFGLRWAAAE